MKTAIVACTMILLIGDGPTFADPPRADIHRCDSAGECGVFPKSCCGECGNATVGDAVALSSDRVGESKRPGCEAVKCPSCAEVDEDIAHQLVAVCEKHVCRLLNLATMPITRCRAHADCVAIPATCCSGYGVAVRKDQAAALRTRMCRNVGCGAGAVHLPGVACIKGRCTVGEP